MTLKQLEDAVYDLFYRKHDERIKQTMDTLTYRKITKAKARHTCDLCNSFIEKNEKYLLSTMADSGTVDCFREHPSCAALVDIIGDGEETYYDAFYEWVMDAEPAFGGDFKEKLDFLKKHYGL